MRYHNGASWSGSQSHDVLPIPPSPPSEVEAKCCPSKRVLRQRLGRKHKAVQQTNELINSLNYLYDSNTDVVTNHTAAHKSIHDRLHRLCLQDRPPNEEAPEASLCAMLGTNPSHYCESQRGPAPYQAGNVSMPATAGGCSLESVLADTDRRDLVGFRERLFLSDAKLATLRQNEGKAKSYWDPS